MSWSIVRTRGDTVQWRDEHTATYDEEMKIMLIFGGFEDGIRVNTVTTYNFTANSWKNVEIPAGHPQPSPRSGHASVIYQGNMYVFGGKNDDSEKLNDLWVYNISEETWTELKPVGDIPYVRSGHSMSLIGENIVVFGGIWDVTKELNDLVVYNIPGNKWHVLNDSANQ